MQTMQMLMLTHALLVKTERSFTSKIQLCFQRRLEIKFMAFDFVIMKKWWDVMIFTFLNVN